MSLASDLFGIAYLDAESFRSMAALFGAGMALADYPATTEGNLKLDLVLQAASRAIDAFCCRSFTPEDRSEQHDLDLRTWQFSVNNPPVSEIVSCTIRYAKDGTISIPPDRVYVNNQKNYCEITRTLDGALTILDITGSELSPPQVEVVYKSLAAVPKAVVLATGYQAGHLINSGFADKMLPPNMGKLDLGGLSVNNKKGYKSSEETRAASLSPDAENLLKGEVKFSIA